MTGNGEVLEKLYLVDELASITRTLQLTVIPFPVSCYHLVMRGITK